MCTSRPPYLAVQRYNFALPTGLLCSLYHRTQHESISLSNCSHQMNAIRQHALHHDVLKLSPEFSSGRRPSGHCAVSGERVFMSAAVSDCSGSRRIFLAPERVLLLLFTFSSSIPASCGAALPLVELSHTAECRGSTFGSILKKSCVNSNLVSSIAC